MAIANTTSASIANWSSSNPATASFDCSGGDFLYVTLFGNGSMSAVSATYNGVALTLLHLTADAEGNKQAVFYLANPASGSNTLSVSRTGGSNLSIVASAYSGTDTTTPIDNWTFDGGGTGLTTKSVSVTVGDADNWLLGSFRYEGTWTGTNTTQRVASSTVLEAIWDTNGTIGSTGSVTETWTSGGFRLVGITLTSLAVAAAAGGSSIKSIAGVTKANIKSMAGVTEANTKSVAGISNV